MTAATERTLDDEELVEFAGYANNGYQFIGKRKSAEAAEIVAAVDAFVVKTQQPPRGFVAKFLTNPPDTTEMALALGIVWGDQLVRALRWEWACLLVDGSERYAVVAPDRSLVVFATYFVKECLDNPTADCTVLLSFNMLLADRMGAQTPGGYSSVMASVRRIVPKGP